MAKTFLNISVDKKDTLSFTRQIRNNFEKKPVCNRVGNGESD